MIRALIVDDEPHARRRIRRLLADVSDVEVVGEAGDGAEAVRDIGTLDPDVVFLDVQMPDLDGFGVLASLDPPLPAIVFVTAYDAYCLRAFDVHAVDYLLKPFADERLLETLERVRELTAGLHVERHRAALTALLGSHPAQPLQRIPVKRGETIHLLDPDHLERIEAAGNRARLFLVDGGTATVRQSLKSLGQALPDHFVRVHRSTIVNVRRIARLHVLFHGELEVELRGGNRVRASRTYVADLRAALGLDRA